MSIRNGVIGGAVLGGGVATVLLLLHQLRPFSLQMNVALERVKFGLCPLYILGFANGISMISLIVITILGNAFLYGFAFGMLTGLTALVRRR